MYPNLVAFNVNIATQFGYFSTNIICINTNSIKFTLNTEFDLKILLLF